MIVPMKKVSLIVLDRERKSALVELRKVGVVHPIVRPAQSSDLTALTDRKGRADTTLNILREIGTAAKKAKKVTAKNEASSVPAAALMDRAHDLIAERKAAEESLSRYRAELARLEPWGVMDPAWFTDLAASGVDFLPYQMSGKAYAALDPSVRVMVISRSKSIVRCLVFREDGKVPAALPDEAVALSLPECSTSALQEKVKDQENRLASIDAELELAATRIDELEQHAQRIAAECEFEKIRAGMEFLTDESERHALVQLEGFAPEADVPAVIAAAKKNGWAVLADDPAADDAVPTKVKNNALVRIIQPVFEFLGTVPNYREYEISALFLLFFCFFFAMIFGDAGYGSVLMFGALFLALKDKSAGKPVADFTRLLLLLASFTIFWGILTMSWFGIDPAKLPPFFHNIDIYWISNENPASGDNVKVLCFFMGTVQLVIAHLKNLRRDISSLKFLAQIGQGAMLVGMLSLVLNLVISSQRFPVPSYAMYLIAGGFILNFVFANYEGSGGVVRGIIGSIVGSLQNIVSVILGVVNVFADIVSYIRLWAVGLAGVAISQTVNSMVDPMLGKAALFVVGIMILVLGHGLNIMMSVLSVIVHGVRLNMLEFSGHLGMEWSGFSYDPFREKALPGGEQEITDTSSKELT